MSTTWTPNKHGAFKNFVHPDLVQSVQVILDSGEIATWPCPTCRRREWTKILCFRPSPQRRKGK